MTKISDLLAAGRTWSFEFFPPKTDEAERALEKAIGELEPLVVLRPSVVGGHPIERATVRGHASSGHRRLAGVHQPVARSAASTVFR